MAKRILSLLVAGIILLTVFAGCGASKRAGTAQSEPSRAVKSEAMMDRASGEGDFGSAETAAASPAEAPKAEEKKAEREDGNGDAYALTGSGSSGQSVSNAILAQRKIIRNANISVEVEDFDKAYGQIKSMISAFGFIQESNIKKDKIYLPDGKEKLITKGNIIIRVDKDKFESILSDIKGLGLLLDESIKSDDVTDKFFDVESRLRLLRYEESRLEQYLLKITDPKVIFQTEDKLTEIRHEIEGLTGTLKKWSDLVELSTITINLTEKGLNSIKPVEKPKTYWERLSGGFMGSIKGVVQFFGEFLIGFVQSLPVLVILAVLVFICVLIYRRFLKRLLYPEDSKKKDISSGQ